MILTKEQGKDFIRTILIRKEETVHSLQGKSNRILAVHIVISALYLRDSYNLSQHGETCLA